MRTGILSINNNDLWTTYNGLLLGRYAPSVVEHPKLKEPEKNEWHEYDGIEVDLESPILDGREFDLLFHFASEDDFELFWEDITESSYSTFKFGELANRQYSLRVVSATIPFLRNNWYEVKVKFAEDTPFLLSCEDLELGEVAYSGSGAGISIDEVPLADYGIVVLGDIGKTLRAPAKVRENLKRQIKTQAGIIYHDSTVKYESRDITLELLIRSDSMSNLLNTYDCLIYNLTTPGEHELTSIIVDSYVYYKSNKVVEVYQNNAATSVYMKLSLTLVETRKM